MAHLYHYKVAYYKKDVLGKITHLRFTVIPGYAVILPPACHPAAPAVILSAAKDLVTPGRQFVNSILNRGYS